MKMVVLDKKEKKRCYKGNLKVGCILGNSARGTLNLVLWSPVKEMHVRALEHRAWACSW